MAKDKPQTKQKLVNKANSAIVAAVAVAAFLVIFSLIATRALWVRQSYQGRVIKEKEVARDQLRTNIDTVEELVVSYKAFTETTQNAIGGNPQGSGEKDGDNAKITLDALPSKYDFPGLTTSIEKVVQSHGATLVSISGVDDEVAQSATAKDDSKVVEMLFDVSALGSYQDVQNVLNAFQASIRPVTIDTLELKGTNNAIEMVVNAKSYYQPGKTLNIEKKVVR